MKNITKQRTEACNTCYTKKKKKLASAPYVVVGMHSERRQSLQKKNFDHTNILRVTDIHISLPIYNMTKAHENQMGREQQGVWIDFENIEQNTSSCRHTPGNIQIDQW